MQKAAKSLIALVFAQKNVSINMFESSLDVGAKNLDEIIGLCNPFCKALKFSESRICVSKKKPARSEKGSDKIKPILNKILRVISKTK